jgi:hypothetical protein
MAVVFFYPASARLDGLLNTHVVRQLFPNRHERRQQFFTINHFDEQSDKGACRQKKQAPKQKQKNKDV